MNFGHGKVLSAVAKLGHPKFELSLELPTNNPYTKHFNTEYAVESLRVIQSLQGVCSLALMKTTKLTYFS